MKLLDILKVAQIKPMLKIGYGTDLTNYRPIAVLNVFQKSSKTSLQTIE